MSLGGSLHVPVSLYLLPALAGKVFHLLSDEWRKEDEFFTPVSKLPRCLRYKQDKATRKKETISF